MRRFMQPAPTLYLDAASPVIAVGLRVGPDEVPTWLETHDEAGVALFRAMETLTRDCGVAIADIATVAYCEGPGSLLGVRLVAMALRTWAVLPRPAPLRVQAYRSLELIAASLLADGCHGPFHVITDGRRATWNTLSVDPAGVFGAIRRRPADEPLPPGERVVYPRDFPHWQPIPPDAEPVAYTPRRLPELAARFHLLRAVEQPDAFMTAMPTYREWTHAHPGRPASP